MPLTPLPPFVGDKPQRGAPNFSPNNQAAVDYYHDVLIPYFTTELPNSLPAAIDEVSQNIVALGAPAEAKLAELQSLLNTAKSIVNNITDEGVIETVIDDHTSTNGYALNDIYVNPNVVGGDGTGRNAANAATDLITALLAVKQGVTNRIFLTSGDVHYAGSANQTIQITKKIYRDTTIIFSPSGGSGNRPEVVFPFFDHSNGFSYAAFRFSADTAGGGVKIKMGGYFVAMRTAKSPSANPVSVAGGVLYSGYGGEMGFYWRGGESALQGHEVFIDDNTYFITPYITLGAAIDISLSHCTLAGDGDFCKLSQLVPINFNAIALSHKAGATGFVFSGLKTDRSHINTSFSGAFLTRSNL